MSNGRKTPTQQLARWSLDLQGFDYEVIHRKGEKNKNADALTRLELPTQNSNTVSSEKEATLEIVAFTVGYR